MNVNFYMSAGNTVFWEKDYSTDSERTSITVLLRGPLCEKATLPTINEKIVWSLPMDTFFPGWNFVPLCRTMILPGETISPPNFFTPSLLDSESRPFLVEPPPFLCAILFPKKLNRFAPQCRIAGDPLISWNAFFF